MRANENGKKGKSAMQMLKTAFGNKAYSMI
jgi:hypothetical protein